MITLRLKVEIYLRRSHTSAITRVFRIGYKVRAYMRTDDNSINADDDRRMRLQMLPKGTLVYEARTS